MAYLNHVFFGILVLQFYVNAVPGDVSKLEVVENASINIEEEGNTPTSPRQKRYFNPYGFPPYNPLIYSNPNVGDFGLDDPLAEIHKRVQSIANNLRQPPPPPPPIQHVPIFFPILFIPPSDCSCAPTNSLPIDPVDTNNNNTSPNVTNRFPEMEDERQNWGIAVNESADDGRDFSRPISFDPIRLNQPNMRPSPPVDRGTLQGEAADNQQPQSTEGSEPPPPENRPAPPPENRPPPPSPSNSGIVPTTTRPPTTFFTPQFPLTTSIPQNGFATGAPTPCDGAILTCCHRLQVTYDCFAIQGCPYFTSYGNPCDYNSILRIIDRFQQFYGNRGL